MATKKTAKTSTYRVWIEQVNQVYVDVKATDTEDARPKAYRKWRRTCAHSRISEVQKLEE